MITYYSTDYEVKNETKAEEEPKEKKKKFTDWLYENTDAIIGGTITLAIIGAVTGVSIAKNVKATNESAAMNVWDPSLGFYWRLRRKLTTNEQLEISTRRAAGEKIGDILADLNVLKKR